MGGVGGAVVGGLLGGAIGGKTGRIIGAVGGAAAGGYVGYKMDQQIKELDEQTEGTGVEVTEVDNGEAILLNLPDSVTFDVGSYTINPTFRATLDTIAENLRKYPNSLIDVYGHTDSTGTYEFNQRLSEQRAQSVANYLQSRGIADARIRWQGFGETQPVASNETEIGRSTNRRVEIKIIPFDEQDVRDAQASQGNY
jgi:outer membrane protein OmpA-like peptidoglycan-associated protein